MATDKAITNGNEITTNRSSANSRTALSLWLPAALLAVLLIMTLAVQVVLSWRAHQNMQPVNGHIIHMLKLQNINLELQKKLVENLANDNTFNLKQRETMRASLQAIIDEELHLAKATPQALSDAHAALADMTLNAKKSLIIALAHTRKAIELEAHAHQALVEKVNHATVIELKIASLTLIAVPVSAAILIFLMRRRVLAPLNRLSFLMTLLAKQDYTPAPLSAIDPMLKPLTENYNAMVKRLAELEHEHAIREQDLEQQVKHAARALLEQQRNLANTERLAAVGETMASISHELRNPLAGVKITCSNLQTDMIATGESPDYIERLTIISNEINRIIALLNALLEQAQHNPEAARDVYITDLIQNLVVLVRYQIPEHISIEQRSTVSCTCRLPEGLLRQALLNMLLNACQAIGDTPGRIVIEAACEQDAAIFRIIDDGPGFPHELIQSGIRTFVSHRPDGTGLGLSMVQRFAQAQGGNIKLTNAMPHGACVTLTLPCGKRCG